MSMPVIRDCERNLKQVITKVFPGSKVITIESGSKVGDGYLGITSTITVKTKKGQFIYLFLKGASENEDFRKAVRLEEAFQREIYFYSTLQPIFEEMCMIHTKNPFDVTAKCFFTSKEKLAEILVFDNLIRQGYGLMRKISLFGKSHMLMLLKKYSKLHACGFILKQERPAFFDEVKQNMGEMFFKICKIYGIPKIMNFLLDILKEHCSPSDDDDILDKLDMFGFQALDSMSKLNIIDDYSTVIHVDCWLNNLMFKYNNRTKQLEDVKLIDFQMCMVNSPIFDVLHIFYVNASTRDILDNCVYYQNYYYSSLSENLLDMNGDPQVLYPREVFLSQWKKHCCYGLLFAFTSLRVIMADPSTSPNIPEMVRKNKLDETFTYTLPDEEEYCRRLKLIMRHLVQQNVL